MGVVSITLKAEKLENGDVYAYTVSDIGGEDERETTTTTTTTRCVSSSAKFHLDLYP